MNAGNAAVLSGVKATLFAEANFGLNCRAAPSAPPSSSAYRGGMRMAPSSRTSSPLK